MIYIFLVFLLDFRNTNHIPYNFGQTYESLSDDKARIAIYSGQQ